MLALDLDSDLGHVLTVLYNDEDRGAENRLAASQEDEEAEAKYVRTLFSMIPLIFRSSEGLHTPSIIRLPTYVHKVNVTSDVARYADIEARARNRIIHAAAAYREEGEEEENAQEHKVQNVDDSDFVGTIAWAREMLRQRHGRNALAALAAAAEGKQAPSGRAAMGESNGSGFHNTDSGAGGGSGGLLEAETSSDPASMDTQVGPPASMDTQVDPPASATTGMMMTPDKSLPRH